MSLVRTIEIAGFRGVRAPLTLSFVKGGSTQSMVILGRNGHGKSSITDAWEWFHTGNIARLNREDAKHSAFPHRQAAVKKDACYVSVVLRDGTTRRQQFSYKTITKPELDGDVEGFRKSVPHPCHLRHEDLTRFVYKTKAEQYEALATLMGFEPQVEFQKTLGKVVRQFKESCARQKDAERRVGQDLAARLGIAAVTEGDVLKRSKDLLAAHGFPSVSTIYDCHASLPELRNQVTSDPRAQELADLNSLRREVTACVGPAECRAEMIAYSQSLNDFKSRERKAADLLLIELYEHGRDIVQSRIDAEEDESRCPLCGSHFIGDLLEHITTELEELADLKAERDKLDKARKALLGKFPVDDGIVQRLVVVTEIASGATAIGLDGLKAAGERIDECTKTARSLFGSTVDLAHAGSEKLIASIADELSLATSELDLRRVETTNQIDSRASELKDDKTRTQLVADVQELTEILSVWTKCQAEAAVSEKMHQVSLDLDKISADFVSSSNRDVSGRFTTISGDVAKYFGILEVSAKTLAKPVLRLVPDQERAVTLEIEFLGEAISPAYKFLSESQLNSFGLGLFLASARHFNSEFKFLILDDIVNSFDGYKRPQVVELLRSEFNDFQLLVMTHDEVWAERLFKAFPSWVRTKFTRFDPEVGPIIGDGLSDLEKIEKDLEDGEANRAGQLLGQLLERELQEICEACEGALAFNRRNEYTLQPLVVGVRERIKEKLKATHPAFLAMKAFEDEVSFRNWCAHWKNPSSPLTTEEIQVVIDKWKGVVNLIQCSDPRCGEYARYDKASDFVCRCRKVVLTKSSTASSSS
jgi:hypothetical protein